MADKQYIGTREVDFIEEKARQIGSLPGIRDILSFAGGVAKFADEAFIDPHRYASEQGEVGFSGALGTVIRGGEFIMDKASEGGGIIAENLGVDPRIGQFVAGAAADTVLTAGVGAAGKKAMQAVDMLTPPPGGGLALAGASDGLVARNGQVRLNSNVMEAVTATDPDILSVTGRKTGETIVDSAQQKLLVKRRSEVQKYQNKLVSLREELALAAEQGADKKVLDDIRDKIGDAEEMLSRRQSNVLVPDSDDPLWYKTSNSKKAKKLEQIRRKMSGTYLEEHHIFPKGMSAAFFNRMDELIASGVAEADDLLLMAEYAAKSGVKAGDVKSNLVNLMKDPHNELHQVLRAQGDEIGKQQWQKILKEANSVDEILALWKDVIGRNVKPNAETARIWQPLDDLVKEIQSK